MSFETWVKEHYPNRSLSASWNGDVDGSIAFAREAYAAGGTEEERLRQENEELRRVLQRIVKSTDGCHPKDHRIDVHVCTIDWAKRVLWP